MAINSLTFRAKLDQINPDQCTRVFKELDQNIESFISAFNRRMSQQLSSRVVINVGDKLRRSINKQLEYLDCFEDLLNTLPIANIPDNILDAMAFVGSTLSFIQGFESTKQVKELFKSFNPISVIVTQMRDELQCMRDSCGQPSVVSLLDRLTIEFDTLDRLFKTNSNLNRTFSQQAKFQKKQREDKLANTIQQFIEAVNRLTC